MSERQIWSVKKKVGVSVGVIAAILILTAVVVFGVIFSGGKERPGEEGKYNVSVQTFDETMTVLGDRVYAIDEDYFSEDLLSIRHPITLLFSEQSDTRKNGAKRYDKKCEGYRVSGNARKTVDDVIKISYYEITVREKFEDGRDIIEENPSKCETPFGVYDRLFYSVSWGNTIDSVYLNIKSDRYAMRVRAVFELTSSVSELSVINDAIGHFAVDFVKHIVV